MPHTSHPRVCLPPIAVGLFALAALPLGAAAAAPGAVHASRTTAAIAVDGRLDEADWATAQPAPEFVQWDPKRGQPASQRTEAFVLFDAQRLYVAARLHRTVSTPPVALVHRRDLWSESDQLRVWLDTAGDGRSALVFGVNAANVQRDAMAVETGDWRWDPSWNAVWESAVGRDGTDWTLELSIPFSALRLRDAGAEQGWGIYFDRFDQGVGETSASIVTERGTPLLAQFPRLLGLADLEPARRFEVTPYVGMTGRLAHAASGDRRGGEQRAGLDLQLALTPGSLLDVALLPDFGQVESDPAVLNLGTVETFLPEKRPFFLAGTDILQVPGTTLFHSRRIGSELPATELAAGQRLLDQPSAAQILGAAKVTGAFGESLQAGVLLARTAAARARLRESSGSERELRLAPATSYAVARLERSLGAAVLGGFASLVDAGSGGRRAAVGAVDGFWKTADRTLTLTGLASASDTRSAAPGEEAGQRSRPAPRSGLYLQATAAKARAGWESSLLLRDISRRYDPNDAGFLERADERRVQGSLQRSWDVIAEPLRNWTARLSGVHAEDQAGRPFESALLGAFSTSFTNNWWAEVQLSRRFAHFDDRELRTFDAASKLYLPREAAVTLDATVATPTNRRWYGRLLLGGAEGGDLTTRWAALEQDWRLSNHLQARLETRYRTEPHDLRWLATVADEEGVQLPVVGDRHLRQLEQSLRLSYAPTTALTLELFTQWLAARWQLDELSAFRAGALGGDLPPAATALQTRFGRTDWNVNAVARWEMRPGSTLSLVYTRGAAEERWRKGVVPNALSELPADETLQLKLAWLFR